MLYLYVPACSLYQQCQLVHIIEYRLVTNTTHLTGYYLEKRPVFPLTGFIPINILVVRGARPLDSQPYLYGFIATSRGNALSVGRPCQGMDPVGVAWIVDGVVPGSSVPDMHGPVITCRGDTFAVR